MPSDFRTRADLESEKAILKILEKEFPKYNIFSEETGEVNKKSEYTFIVDPLDGTNNFVLGIPYFSVSIGLMEGGKTIFGVVYNPMLRTIYCAEKGKGSYLNNKAVHVSQETDIRKCSVSITYSYDTYKESGERFNDMYGLDAKRVLANWSPALDLCLLSSGKIEAILANKIEPHDFIAGKLIAKEAGALITDFKGEKEADKNDIFLATNGTKIHQEILKNLQK